jgi:TP901 family phage tail tape measure protein
MGVVANLSVRISASIEEFRAGLDQAASAWKKTGAQMQSVGSAMTAAITLPLVGIGVAATRAGLDFEDAINQISGVLRPTATEMDALRARALEMGAATAFSATDAATAILELGKAGFTVKESLGGVDEVLQLAAASGLTMGEAAELSARTIAGFGLSVTDLAHVNDVLAAAVNASTLEITDLQTAFGYVAPIAKGFGLSIEQVTAALAIMRDAGIAAETSGRALREGLGRLANPKKAVDEVMGQLGIDSFTKANGELMNLSQIVGLLQEKGMTAAQSLKMFGDAAGPAMFALVTQGQGALDELTLKLQNSSGAAADMAKAMMQGLPGAFEELKGAVETAFIAISKALEPVLIPLLQGLTSLANFVITTLVPAFSSLPAPVQTGIVAFAGILAAIGPLLAAIGTITVGVTGLVALFPALGTALATVGGVIAAVVTGPIGLIAGALVAATAAWVLFGDDIKRIVSDIYTAVKTWLVDMWQDSIFQHLADMLIAMGQLFIALHLKALEGVMAVYTAVKTWILDKLQPIFTALKPIVEAIATAFVFVKDKVTETVTAIFTAVKTWLLDKFNAIVQGIKDKIDAVTGFFRDMYTKVVGKSYVPDMVAGIGEAFGRLDVLMVAKTQGVTGLVSKAFETMGQAVMGTINNLIGSMSNMLSGWLDNFMPSWAARLVGGLANSAMGAGSNALSGLLGGIGGRAAGGGLLGGLIGGGGSALGGLIGGGGGLASGAAINATTAGLAGGGGATAGLGAFFTNPITIGAAAAAAIGVAIWKGGLFRGGEEALKVNPARDEFLSQFGDVSNKDVGGAGWNLAAKLTEMGFGEGGGQIFADLQRADSMEEYERALKAVQEALETGAQTATTDSAALQQASANSSVAVDGLAASISNLGAMAQATSAAILGGSAASPPFIDPAMAEGAIGIIDPTIYSPEDLVPAFASGSGGFRNFGTGTLAMLHGTEAVVRPEDMAGAGPRITVSLNGTLIGNSREFENAVGRAMNSALERGGPVYGKNRRILTQMFQG